MQISDSGQQNLWRFKLRVSFDSDWHIGQGAGRPGDINRLVHRDCDGLPWVPAKTLTGILRDACEKVALGLDDGARNGDFWKWVSHIFGEQPVQNNAARLERPLPAALSIRAARFPSSLRAALTKRPHLLEALTLVKVGVKIDARTGAAMNDHLYFDELARGGAVLEADCQLSLPENEDSQRLIRALLLAGASQVEHLGGKRRRGNGRCRIEVIPADSPAPIRETWVGWLEAAIQNLPSLPLMTENVLAGEFRAKGARGSVQTNAQDDGWVVLELRLRAETPLVIPSRTLGNIVETLDYVPGTYLLPIISRLLDRCDVSPLDALARGDVLVTNATPEVAQSRGMPVPLALFHPKGAGGLVDGKQVWNRLVENDPSREIHPTGSDPRVLPLRNHRVGWLETAVGAQLPPFKQVSHTTLMHNTIDDGPQRPTTDVGGLYACEALAPGTVLRADIRMRANVARKLEQSRPEWWLELVGGEGELCLGRAKKDEYGRVRLEVLREPRALEPQHTGASNFVVWLQSQVLLRDSYLRPTSDPASLIDALSRKLGVTLMEVGQGPALHDTLLRTGRIDSWQTRWGLPRPSLIGLAAGSCLLVKSETVVSGEKLKALEIEGIGERRAEGYGQLRINSSLLQGATSALVREDISVQGSDAIFDPLNADTCPKGVLDYTYLLEREALRSAISRKAESRSADPSLRQETLGISINEKGRSSPSLSQLGTLRSRVAALNAEGGRKQLELWINKVTESKRTTDKALAKVAGKVQTLMLDPGLVWDHLDLRDFSPYAATEGGADRLKSDLATSALMDLIFAVLRQHRRQAESSKEGKST